MRSPLACHGAARRVRVAGAATETSVDQTRIVEAAGVLAAMHRGEAPTRAKLPDGCQPATAGEAHEIQDALIAALGGGVSAWKVGPPRDGVVMRGGVLPDRLLESPATIAATRMPLMGVEAEIAFRIEETLAPRGRDYSYDDVAAVVTALVAIEVVDSRFESYADAPFLDRAADMMSNGALVIGTVRPDWRGTDLSALEAVLTMGGREIVRGTGGHGSGDPLIPAVQLINDVVRTAAVPAGTILTTGTFTGLNYAKAGDTVVAEFVGFGRAEVTFAA